MASFEALSVAPLKDEITKGRMLARSIIAALPHTMSHLLPADQLALCTLLGTCGGMTIGRIAEHLGLPVSTTVELVDRTVESGRVERWKIGHRTRVHRKRSDLDGDGRHSIITLAPKGKLERRRARGAERFGIG